MKILLIISAFLFSFSAHADLQVKRSGTEYAFSFVERGIQYCLIMPEWVDLNYFNGTWTTVPQTAIDRNWPAGVVNNCVDAPVVPKTLTTARFELSPSGTMRRIADAPVGTPCGDAIAQTYGGIGWRSVTHGGITGIGVCS